MSNIYTIIGDPHAKPANLEKIAKLQQNVEELGNTCIWMGDMLDTKEVIRGKALNVWLEYFSKSKIFHYVLVGNHDWFNLQCEDHSLQALKSLDNVLVIDKTFELGDSSGVFAMPYLPPDKTTEELKKLPEGSTLLCHIDTVGFDYGNGHVSSEGVSLKDLKKFKRVISGHYHKFQEKANLTYIGTPFSHSFGETDQIKYIGILEVEQDRLEVVETTFPRHKTVEFDCDGLNEHKEHWIIDLDKPDAKDHLYRVILTGKQENIDRFPRDMYKNFNVKWVTKPSDFQLNDVKIEESTSNEAQFSSWAKEVAKLDEETISLGLKIMEDVA